jgi:HNH endonuclease
VTDIWDPNNWVVPDHEFRIYSDDRLTHYAIVDEVDYHWAIRWRWHLKVSKGGTKFYLFRTQSEYSPGVRKQVSVFLHVEITKRFRPIRPSANHTISDHRNGNSLDCRRSNLRWATPSMNRLNLHGEHPYDLAEDAVCLVEDKDEPGSRDPQADAGTEQRRVG